jgi:hypothetical protein
MLVRELNLEKAENLNAREHKPGYMYITRTRTHVHSTFRLLSFRARLKMANKANQNNKNKK